ncbi:hypothetical protein LTR78_009349 [Recurvomyces mirabilis]|uniref:Uncharacterized protein n=1 Tax=Recurvomyces mirabilis TaxID=574656 RepID=A0AAE0WHF5_9PEZI|nr:hypothetical protein LTR78_009349 [Recurvomyces mirabilis]
MNYRPDAYETLPNLAEAIARFRGSGRLEAAFRSAKAIFAEYNKWSEYGIVMPFKDVHLQPDERLVEVKGTTIPWRGYLNAVVEQHIVPHRIRAWEVRDIMFEQEAVSNLGGLGLVRLDTLRHSDSAVVSEVEAFFDHAAVVYSDEISKALLTGDELVPIMWKFHLCQEGPSSRYRITPIRFRLLHHQPTWADSPTLSTAAPHTAPLRTPVVRPPSKVDAPLRPLPPLPQQYGRRMESPTPSGLATSTRVQTPDTQPVSRNQATQRPLPPRSQQYPQRIDSPTPSTVIVSRVQTPVTLRIEAAQRPLPPRPQPFYYNDDAVSPLFSSRAF